MGQTNDEEMDFACFIFVTISDKRSSPEKCVVLVYLPRKFPRSIVELYPGFQRVFFIFLAAKPREWRNGFTAPREEKKKNSGTQSSGIWALKFHLTGQLQDDVTKKIKE